MQAKRRITMQSICRTNTFRRVVSLILCIVTVVSAFSALSFKASSADTLNIPCGVADDGYIYDALASEMREAILDLSNYEYNEKKQAYAISINVYNYNLPTSDIATLVSSFTRRYTELFFLKNSYAYSRIGTTVYAVIFYLTGTPAEVALQVSDFLTASNKLVGAAAEIPDDVGRILWVHDRLALNCVYNENVLLGTTEPESVYTAYGSLCNGDAVCQGYAYAYKYILSRLNILCEIIVSDSMCHAWNLVKIGDKWYHVDVTWDDPAWDMIGRVYHTNFLLSDDGIKYAGTPHSEWNDTNTSLQTTTAYSADSSEYEGRAWRNMRGAIEYRDGFWYYSDGYGKSCEIRRTDVIDTDSIMYITLLKTASYWNAESGGYYVFSLGIAIYGNTLYFNTFDTIYACDLSGNILRTVFKYTQPNSYTNIYGLRIANGTVYYSICSDYNATPTAQREQIAASELFYDRYVAPNGLVYTLDSTTKTASIGNTSNCNANGVTTTASSYTIPSHITLNGVSYKVNKVCDGAFSFLTVPCELTFEGDQPEASLNSFEGSDIKVFYDSSKGIWNVRYRTWLGMETNDTAIKEPDFDPDGDGVTSIKDVIMLDAYINGFIRGDMSACDLNQDGTINEEDVCIMMRAAKGKYE